MQIAIVKNNIVEKSGEHRKLFPNISFPKTGPSEDWLKNNSAWKITSHIDLPNTNCKIVETTPYFRDDPAGGHVYSVKVVELSDEEKNEKNTQSMTLKRQIRNMFLDKSDWTQMPDSPLSDSKKTEWATYRQKLRDFTSLNDWVNTEFPDKPS